MYPQRSVMTCGLATALEPPHFNHAPVWGATWGASCRLFLFLVSIHAPAWGATFWGCKKPRCIPWFQSTHSRGVRLRVLVRAYSIQPFQSTHPRGVRPARISAVLIYRAVSIHAPAWGATAAYWPAGGLYQGFNPRTRVGCDLLRISMILGLKVFQSTHPRGVRR